MSISTFYRSCSFPVYFTTAGKSGVSIIDNTPKPNAYLDSSNNLCSFLNITSRTASSNQTSVTQIYNFICVFQARLIKLIIQIRKNWLSISETSVAKRNTPALHLKLTDQEVRRQMLEEVALQQSSPESIFNLPAWQITTCSRLHCAI